MGKLIRIHALHVVYRSLDIEDNNFLNILDQGVVINHFVLEGSIVPCVCPKI
jgi:hypothetical protein